jgi:hypothetical protein
VIKKDDAQLSWFGEMQRKTGLFGRSVSKYIRQGTKKISSISFKGQSFLKRQFSRGASFGRRDSNSEVDEDDEDEYGSFKRTKSLKTNKSFSRSLSRSLSNNTKNFKRSMSRNTLRTAHHINSTLVGLVRSRLFRHIELLLISINFVILCCITATMSQKTANTIRIHQIIDIVCFCIFLHSFMEICSL